MGESIFPGFDNRVVSIGDQSHHHRVLPADGDQTESLFDAHHNDFIDSLGYG
jgi:hypothetical protein